MPVRSAISSVPQRWIVCVLCSSAFAYIACKNFCFYQIKDMVDSMTEKKITPSDDGCPFLFFDEAWLNRYLPFNLPDFYWENDTVNKGNTAFKAGKFLAVLPAGLLSDIGYSKYVLGGGMFLVAASHLLLPALAHFGISIYVVENLFDGVGEASIYPSIYSLISRWSPPSQRSAFTGFVVAGIFYGEALGYTFFNVFYVEVFGTWSGGQYTTGLVGMVWVGLCGVFLYHSPDESPFVSHHEIQAIASSHQSLRATLHRLQGVPWRVIVTSRYFLSLVFVFCSLDWVVYLNIYGILLYYQHYILRLPIEFCGRSVVVFIVVVPSLVIGGLFGDWMIRHKLTTKSVIRRTFAFLSVCCSSVLIVTASFVGCNITVFWALVVTGVYTIGLAVPIIYSTPIDLSPQHAGLLMGIMLLVRTTCSMCYEQFAGLIRRWTPDFYSSTHWRGRFIFRAVLALAMLIPFLFFGSKEARIRRRPIRPTRSVLQKSSTELQPSHKSMDTSSSKVSK